MAWPLQQKYFVEQYATLCNEWVKQTVSLIQPFSDKIPVRLVEPRNESPRTKIHFNELLKIVPQPLVTEPQAVSWQF